MTITRTGDAVAPKPRYLPRMTPSDDKPRTKITDIPLLAWVVLLGVLYGAGHALLSALGVI